MAKIYLVFLATLLIAPAQLKTFLVLILELIKIFMRKNVLEIFISENFIILFD